MRLQMAVVYVSPVVSWLLSLVHCVKGVCLMMVKGPRNAPPPSISVPYRLMKEWETCRESSVHGYKRLFLSSHLAAKFRNTSKMCVCVCVYWQKWTRAIEKLLWVCTSLNHKEPPYRLIFSCWSRTWKTTFLNRSAIKAVTNVSEDYKITIVLKSLDAWLEFCKDLLKQRFLFLWINS